MANPWKGRILAYNKKIAEKGEKANDLDVLVTELLFQLIQHTFRKINTSDFYLIIQLKDVFKFQSCTTAEIQ